MTISYRAAPSRGAWKCATAHREPVALLPHCAFRVSHWLGLLRGHASPGADASGSTVFRVRRSTFSVLLLLASCAAPAPAPQGPVAADRGTLLALLANVSTPEESRRAADRQLAALAPADEARLAILEQLLYTRGQSEAMRIHAIDQLAAADAPRAARALALYLPRMDDWPVLTHACQVAAQLHRPELVPPLIRSLARPAKTIARRDRPEVPAIEKLSGQKIPVALAEIFLTGRDRDARIAALELLPEFSPADQVKKHLASAQADVPDSLLTATQWSIRTFDYLPHGRNEVEWLTWLAHDTHHTHVHAMHQALAQQPDYAFAPRFAGILATVRKARDAALRLADRKTLEERIAGDLAKLRHITREPQPPKAAYDNNERFAANLPKLSRCDLLTIAVLLENLRRPELCQEIVRLGLADLADTSTEHGGLIAPDAAGQLQLEIFPPHAHAHDQTYLASDKLFAATPRGLAHFHFHYQKLDNAAHAGPGAGDLAYARENRVNCIVITAISRREFNVDYYTPNGAVVDLGVYKEP